MSNTKKETATPTEQEPQAQPQAQPQAGQQLGAPTTSDDGSVSLDPRAIKILLDAVDAATRRGAFSIQEVGNISSAYSHTQTAISSITQAQQSQQKGDSQ